MVTWTDLGKYNQISIQQSCLVSQYTKITINVRKILSKKDICIALMKYMYCCSRLK